MASTRRDRSSKPPSPRRREVLDEATRLFCERGYGGTSMDDVADAVNLTKGTLYHHFSGKGKILAQIYEEAADFVLAKTEEASQDSSPADSVRSLIRGIMELIEQRRHLVTVFYQEMPWVDRWLEPTDARRVQRKIRRYIDHVESLLQRGMDTGEFLHLDVHATAYALIGIATWSYQWWNPEGPYGLQDMTDLLAGIFLRGITPREQDE